MCVGIGIYSFGQYSGSSQGDSALNEYVTGPSMTP